MPLQHPSWSTVLWKNTQRQGSAISCWGTKRLGWEQMSSGTLQDWELRAASSWERCLWTLSSSWLSLCSALRHRNFFLTYCFSSSLTTELSVICRSRGGGCDGRSVPSHGSFLLTLCACSKCLDLPCVYHENTFRSRGRTLCCPLQRAILNKEDQQPVGSFKGCF